MINIIKPTLALGLVVAAAVLTSTAEAEIHSRSKDLVVMEPTDLPEQAQTPGNSFLSSLRQRGKHVSLCRAAARRSVISF
jgi:hypothetical protein